MHKSLKTLCVLVAFLIGCQQNPVSVDESLQQYEAAAAGLQRYIVVFAPGIQSKAESEKLSRTLGFKVGHVYSNAISGFSAELNSNALQALRRNPNILSVETDLILKAIGQTLPSGINRIDADLNVIAAIDNTDSELNVDIAILDTGIDDDNSELNVAGGIRFYTVNSGPPKNRGQFSDSNYDDDNGHGTHVAGTVAARDNSYQVVGVAPGARLWGVKILDYSGSGYLSDIIKGIDWVTANSDVIEVVNMSLGAQGYNSAFRTALQNCVNAGVVVVVAAGNESSDVYGNDGVFGTSDDFIPASYPEVSAVSAICDSDGLSGGIGGGTSYGADDQFASFSNYSRSVIADNPVRSPGGAIDVAAPGVNILSTYYNGGTAISSGTSMASPHVAGAVALYILQNGRASDATGVYTLRQAIIDGAQSQSEWCPVVSTDPDNNHEGLVYLGRKGNKNPIVTIISPSSGIQVESGTAIDFSGTAIDNEDGDITHRLVWSSDIDGQIGTGGTFTISNLSIGTHSITAIASDDSGATGAASVSIVVTEPAPNSNPIVTIISPSIGTQVMSGTVIDFTGTAIDNEDGDITHRLVWSSDIDGQIGTGGAFTIPNLSIGTHSITAIASDDSGATGAAAVSIVVTEPIAQPSIHISDIDALKEVMGKSGKWAVTFTVKVVDQSGFAVSNGTVSATVSGAASANLSAITGSDGTALFKVSVNSGSSLSFAITDVSASGSVYDSSANTDPDGDSDGTSITVIK